MRIINNITSARSAILAVRNGGSISQKKRLPIWVEGETTSTQGGHMMYNSKDLILGAIATLLLCCPPTNADTHSLQPGGGPATQIQDAIDLAQDGDTIELSSGYWAYGQDYLPFDLDGKRLAIKGEENGWVVLGTDGKERFDYIITIDDAISKGTSIENLWFTGNGPDTGGVISINQSNVAVNQCVFTGLQGLYENGITAIDSTLSVTPHLCHFQQPAVG